jgi:peptidoglycan/xylan/chitin deacetylase (PgdA/CDA1 family)
MMKRALLILTLILLAAAGAFAYSKSRTSQLFGDLVARVDTDRKVVALTFDDGPTDYAADEVLRALGDVKVTFFVMGADLHRDMNVGRRLVAAGHQLANHTWHHERMLLKSPAYIASEIESTDAEIRAAGWRGPIVFRPPFGKKLVGLPWYLWRHHRVTVTWDVAPDSARTDRDTAAIVADVLRDVRPGSIILLHPWYHGRERTRAAIAPIIAGLRARGYDFVTVNELLRLKR